MAWDGHKMEEEKMWNAKKRANNATAVHHEVGLCMKFDCANREKKCGDCFKFSEYVKNA